MTSIIVLYDHPDDVQAFERHYEGTHLPLVGRDAATLGV